MNTLQRLHAEQDQSPWIDFIDRELINSGRLDDLIDEGIRGLTSNPTIFAKAIASGKYDELIKQQIDAGHGNAEIFEEIAVSDVGDAADELRRVYDESNGTDGFASIEVEPELADDTAKTVERARHLWERLNRPNVFIKIPATDAGVPAITECIAEGININVTLMFSVDVYRDVAHAYLEGLRRRRAAGHELDRLASVASFFVSRVDTKVDKQLQARTDRRAADLLGKAAIANAKMAYQAYLEIFHGPEFDELRAAGAQVQRCLWASTSTKNPDYRDVLYVEELIGPETVNTMPIDTINAFLDHGNVQRTVDRNVDEARDVLRDLGGQGIDMDQVTDELIEEGVKTFAKSFEDLMDTIDSQRKALATA
ncbi:MAG TPA: transaldolase [Candidatus Limnocylindria bacterium]|nr:transaldolase [Candidatus Limnocylindria bacterium]